MNFVWEALQLEDTVKNYEHRNATGWCAPNPLVFHFVKSYTCLLLFLTYSTYMNATITDNWASISDSRNLVAFLHGAKILDSRLWKCAAPLHVSENSTIFFLK